MILSDETIKKLLDPATADDRRLIIDPLVEDNIEPASVDLRLSNEFKRPIKTGTVVDTRSDTTQEYESFEADSIVLEPGDSLLSETMEYISLPNNICADVVGRSSTGRLFVSVHETAGFGDPGFEGTITLEMTNSNPNPVRLHAGDRICQIVFKKTTTLAERPYGHGKSQYQKQTGPTESGMQFE